MNSQHRDLYRLQPDKIPARRAEVDMKSYPSQLGEEESGFTKGVTLVGLTHSKRQSTPKPDKRHGEDLVGVYKMRIELQG